MKVTAVLRNVTKSKRQNDVREVRKSGVIERLTSSMAVVILDSGKSVKVKQSNLEKKENN